MMRGLKNKLLLSTYVISMIPSFFFGSCYRLNLGLLIERSTRVDFFFMYYGVSINYLILTYCVLFPKGIDKRVGLLVFIISALDLIHLILLGKQGFGLTKIGFAIAILIVIEFYRKKNGAY